MDFVAVMLFTQQVFHLECLLLIQIKSQTLFSISLRRYCQKSFAKNGGLDKIYLKRGDDHNRGKYLKKGGSNLTYTIILSD